MREIKTIYSQLQELLCVKICPAPDEWDKLYNVDFYIEVNGKYIGLQIKPVSLVPSIPEIYKERNLQHKSHEKFYKKYGGKVFYIYSCKSGDKKVITNIEVVDEIRDEIKRLSEK